MLLVATSIEGQKAEIGRLKAEVTAKCGQAVRVRGGEVLASFRDTGKNREMRALYQMMGFRLHGTAEDGSMVFRADSAAPPIGPAWVAVS